MRPWYEQEETGEPKARVHGQPLAIGLDIEWYQTPAHENDRVSLKNAVKHILSDRVRPDLVIQNSFLEYLLELFFHNHDKEFIQES